MWSYYGAKTNLVDYYPAPRFDKIIEPFAGSARYSLKYFDRDILLVDKYPVIIDIWRWLQKCSPQDILSLPRKFNPGQSLDEFNFDCVEAKLFMGFMCACASYVPIKKPTLRKTVDRPNFTNFGLQRVAKNLYKIKHWKLEVGSYEDIKNEKATWFIDPPYQHGGHCYIHSNKKIDFIELSNWCKNRNGQVMVCENTKANWMDFSPLKKQRGSLKTTTEAIWLNEKSVFDNNQMELLF